MSVAANSPRTGLDGRFYVWASIVAGLIVFVGFARSYFLQTLFGTPALPLLVHVHGLVMTSWFVLFFAQTCLIATRRVDLHRRLGVFGGVLAILVVVFGVIVSVHAAARFVSKPSNHGPQFLVILGFNLVDILVFASLVGTAVIFRRRADYHKRLMLLATLSILGQPLARIFSNLTTLMLVYLCVLFCVAIDTVRHRRLHPAFAWGAPSLIVALHLAYLGCQTTAWMQFARWLLS
jgi:hypothetical protein